MTAASIAQRTGVRRGEIDRQCASGIIRGAFFDRRTWQWWVPLSAFSALAAALKQAA